MLLILTLLLSLFLFVPLACAQPAPDASKAGAPKSATPEAQQLGRRPADERPCELYLNEPTGVTPARRAQRVCGNHSGVPKTITKVYCITSQGTLVFRPQLSGGSATSILSTPLTCPTTGAVGILNGQPRLDSFAHNSHECPRGACAIDFIVETVDGVQEATLTIVRESE